MKNMKKIVTIMLLFAVIITGGIINKPQAVMASQKSDALKAYRDFLSENKWDEGELGTVHGKYFGLKDLNGDKIPELIINQSNNKDGNRCYAIFSYYAKDKTVTEVSCSWVFNECYFNKSKKYIVDDQSGKDLDYLWVYKVSKSGYCKDVATVMIDRSGHKAIATINGKKASVKEAEKKFASYKKNVKLLQTPYKINKKNINKYVK